MIPGPAAFFGQYLTRHTGIQEDYIRNFAEFMQ